MRKHPVRKFFTLLVVYAAIIVGIFVLQFKTESIISKTIGALHISLAQTESENNEMTLRNQFKASFRGFTVSCSEKEPAYGITSKDEKQALELVSFEDSETAAIFSFKDGTKIAFNVSGLDSNSELSILVIPSSRFKAISLPYHVANSYNIDDSNEEHALITSKSNYFMLNAHDITDGRITLTKTENVAKFLNYDPSKRFTYEAVAGLANTTEESFQALSKDLRESMVSKIRTILNGADTDSLSEADIVAYVAEQALSGKYNETLDQVPESFKKGNKRTYLSTPYFNNLASMNRSLVIQTSRYESMVLNSVSSKNLDVFTADRISDYILREKYTNKIKQLLSLPSTLMETSSFTPNVEQAAGILNVYSEIYKADPATADSLKNCIQLCLDVIAENCNFENNQLTIQETTETLSSVQIVQIGNALVKAGEALGRSELSESGYLIIHTELSKQTPDLRTLTDIYTVLAPENTYYPHTEILGYYGNTCVWAWTCANSISYIIDSENIVNINIDFPLYYTHHIIFNGIPTFHGKIEIQKQMFRTDPRFETYNSSGYVYQADAETLLIKSRHKSKIELIRLYCDPAYNFTK